MASLFQVKNGWQTGYRLQISISGKRHSVWLGPVRKSEATTIKLHVEAVLQSHKLRTPLPTETQRWIKELPAELRSRLRPVLGTDRTVDEVADLYVAHCEATLKVSTARGNADTANQFAADYGSMNIRSISGEQIDIWLGRQNVAASTVGKHVKNLRAWFSWLLRSNYIDAVPTIETPSTIGVGEKEFIDFDTFQRIIDHFAGDREMQCILALSRWCGLRVASEVCPLLRSSIDLATDRLKIFDTKRTHRQSRAPPVIRELPLFAGLRPYVIAMLDLPGRPHDYLLPAIGGQDPERVGSRLRNRVNRAQDRLGIPRWPRVFHSVRATRQTQLKELFGEKVACDWIGNTTDVSRRNYELIADEIFTRAVDA